MIKKIKILTTNLWEGIGNFYKKHWIIAWPVTFIVKGCVIALIYLIIAHGTPAQKNASYYALYAISIGVGCALISFGMHVGEAFTNFCAKVDGWMVANTPKPATPANTTTEIPPSKTKKYHVTRIRHNPDT